MFLEPNVFLKTVTVSFEQVDWMNGLARIMMDAIKSLPKEERKYLFNAKSWVYNATRENREFIAETYLDWLETQPVEWDLPVADTRAEEWSACFDASGEKEFNKLITLNKEKNYGEWEDLWRKTGSWNQRKRI
jgi:hypothetical protein